MKVFTVLKRQHSLGPVLVATALLWCAPQRPAGAQGATGARRAETLGAGNHTLTLNHGGKTRRYVLHIPRGVVAARPVPLIVAFHGGGGEAVGFQDYAGLDAVSDREGFVVAYPNGSGPLPQRLLTWNAGDCCGYAMNNRVDDVGFAIALIDDVSKRVSVDAGRVYATGHSNGAMMAYRLAAERADRIAAIVPVAGAYNLATFAPSRPVAVLAIHSADDTRALYGGGMGPAFPGTNTRSSHRPVMDALEQWRTTNGCSPTPVTRDTRTRAATGGTEVQSATYIVWEGCVAGAPVAHWKLTNVGHAWPGNTDLGRRADLVGPETTIIDSAEEIWRFVKGVKR